MLKNGGRCFIIPLNSFNLEVAVLTSAWQDTHIKILPIALLVMAGAALLCRLCLDRTPYKKLVLRIIVILLLAGEAYKQMLALRTGHYSLSYLPLHFSSSFYFSTFLAAFGRKGVERFGCASTFVGGVFLLVVLFASPGAVIGNLDNIFKSYFTAHSFFMHILIVQFWLLMLCQGVYRPQKYDYLFFWCFLLMWAGFTLPLATKLQINYAGLLKSYIPFLETIRLKYGAVVYLFAYGGLAFICSYLLIAIYRAVYACYRKPGFHRGGLPPLMS